MLKLEIDPTHASPLAIKVELGLDIVTGNKLLRRTPIASMLPIDKLIGFKQEFLKLVVSQEHLKIAAIVRLDNSSSFFEKS